MRAGWQAVIITGLVVAGWLTVGPHGRGFLIIHAQTVPASAPAELETVAIVPFVNLSGRASDDWIGAGIAESVAADFLSQQRFAVVAPADAISDSGASRVSENAAWAQEAEAHWLLSGSYQRLGDRLRVIARWVDVTTGVVLHTVRFDGSFDELFDLQDRIVTELLAKFNHASRSAVTTPRGADNDVAAAFPDRETLSPSASASAGGLVLGEQPNLATQQERTPHSDQTGKTNNLPAELLTRIDGPQPLEGPGTVARDNLGRLTIRAVRLELALELDGKLDEPIYQTVPPLTDFVQQEPIEGAPATEKTDAWVMFSPDTLYISARCWSTDPTRIVANEMKRDSPGLQGNETFSIVLDTFYDHRNGYNFLTNALGALLDAQITDESGFNADWNTVWDVKTDRFDGGWTVEIAIPFKSLRYRKETAQLWGINIRRRVAYKNELSFLSSVPASAGQMGLFRLSSAATLVGIEVPASSLNLELKPYGIASLKTDSVTPPVQANELNGSAGFDVKYGVTEGLTADFTVNTDFAQVEIDEQQVNLTRFSLFFPEKREFFLEGQGIFQFGGGRRISSGGSSSQRGSARAPILFFSRRIGLEDGNTVPILGGARLNGKTGPFSVGVLGVRTGKLVDSGTYPTNFFVGRLKYDVLRRSSIGGIFTRRSTSNTRSGVSQTYGVDATFSFYDNLNINTYVARNEVLTLSDDNLSYRAQLDYNADRWGIQFDRLAIGSNFNPEVGFVQRDDLRRSFAFARFSPRLPTVATIRKLSWSGGLDYITNGAGILETRLRQGRFGIEFESGDQLTVGLTDSYEFLREPFPITPGVVLPIGGYSFLNARVGLTLATQRTISGGFTIDHGDFFSGSKTSFTYFRSRVTATSQLTFEPSLSLNWVDLPEGNFTAQLVSTRATYTITPRVFLAGLLQFNSSNKSVSTNVRFRWEYQPGSELFVVYTDERATLHSQVLTLENRGFVVKFNRLFRF